MYICIYIYIYISRKKIRGKLLQFVITISQHKRKSTANKKIHLKLIKTSVGHKTVFS